MFKNYFKIAWRNLARHKSFSVINISGLAIGMASAMLIFLWIQNEVSHDRFHAKLDRLYQVWSNDRIDGSIRSLPNTPEIMAPTLKKDYPDMEEVTRVSWTRNLLSVGGDKKLMSVGSVVDADFFSMFSFPLLSGDIATVMNDPYAIVLTKPLADKLFPHTDPIGKAIRMGSGTRNFTVTGVLKPIPNNTQFDNFEYLCSYQQMGNIDKDWSNLSINTYVLLKPNVSADAVSNKIKTIIPQHTNGGQKTAEFLYPVKDLWLYSQFENGQATGGRILIVKTFFIIALFILLIACINFMNLSTARSERRAKEVGMRKVAGALKRSLVGQFLGESILIAFIAGVFALLLVALALPAFNLLTGKQLEMEYGNVYFWLAWAGFILFTGVLAGCYPAFVLSAFKPASVLKGAFNKRNGMVTPRKVLVVLQFGFAIVLIISTIVITQQIKYAQGRQTGYDQHQLAQVFIYDDVLRKNFGVIRNELLRTGTATGVTLAQAPLTENWSAGNSLKWQGQPADMRVQINRYSEAGGLVKTAGMQLVSGRDIDIDSYPSDSTACLINETALRMMKFKNPIGQMIYDDPRDWHVVGVVKDYIQESPYQPIRPMIIKGPKEWAGVILVKLNAQRPMAANIAGMEKIFKLYNPAYPFEYAFVDDEYARKFAGEQLIGELAALFAGLTIFISCLGLFGLAAYMAQNRIKEIGVRKVLGASVASITLLLSTDFVKLVAVAFVIASPVAWWGMSNWLNNYGYRIQLHWWVFALAGVSSIVIALLTVGYESVKAAVANPVRSLRAE